MFNILSKNITKTYTIQKSKFLTFGFFVKNDDEIKKIINKLKKEYSDASHICYAYILNDEKYYFSDGGEPSGCAGQPIYNAIKSKKLNYCLFVVIRYFGGIKFGTGPLRSTFKTITSETLNETKCCEAHLADVIKINVNYSQISEILKLFKNQIIEKSYKKEQVWLSIEITNNETIQKLNKFGIKPQAILKNQIII